MAHTTGPHGAQVSATPPRIADVVAPERGVATGSYRAGGPRDKHHHRAPPRRHLPRWLAPAAIAGVVAVGGVGVVVATGGSSSPSAGTSAATSVAATSTSTAASSTTSSSSTSTTTAVTTTTESVLSLAQAVTGTYSLTGFETSVVTDNTDPGIPQPGTQMTPQSLEFTSTCTGAACTIVGYGSSTAVVVGSTLTFSGTFALQPCATDPSRGVTGTYQATFTPSARAADGHATTLTGTVTLVASGFDVCAVAPPVTYVYAVTATRP